MIDRRRRDNVVVAVHVVVVGVVDEGSSVVIVTIFHDDMAKRIMNNEAGIYPNYQTRHTSNKQHHSSSMRHLLFFFTFTLLLARPLFGRLWNVLIAYERCCLMRRETESFRVCCYLSTDRIDSDCTEVCTLPSLPILSPVHNTHDREHANFAAYRHVQI